MMLPTFDRDLGLDKLPLFKQSRELREKRVSITNEIVVAGTL